MPSLGKENPNNIDDFYVRLPPAMFQLPRMTPGRKTSSANDGVCPRPSEENSNGNEELIVSIIDSALAVINHIEIEDVGSEKTQ